MEFNKFLLVQSWIFLSLNRVHLYGSRVRYANHRFLPLKILQQLRVVPVFFLAGFSRFELRDPSLLYVKQARFGVLISGGDYVSQHV